MTTSNLAKLAATSVFALIFLLAIFSCDSSTDTQQRAQTQATGEVHEFVFEGYMTGFLAVGGEFDGIKNPVIEVDEGDEVRIRFINKEAMAHDIALDKHNVASEMLLRVDEEDTISFIATTNDEYYCTVPGHRQTGMVGELRVRPAGGGTPIAQGN